MVIPTYKKEKVDSFGPDRRQRHKPKKISFTYLDQVFHTCSQCLRPIFVPSIIPYLSRSILQNCDITFFYQCFCVITHYVCQAWLTTACLEIPMGESYPSNSHFHVIPKVSLIFFSFSLFRLFLGITAPSSANVSSCLHKYIYYKFFI